jgi:hypothetical protein
MTVPNRLSRHGFLGIQCGNAVRHTGELFRIAQPGVVAFEGPRIADSF